MEGPRSIEGWLLLSTMMLVVLTGCADCYAGLPSFYTRARRCYNILFLLTKLIKISGKNPAHQWV